MDGLKVGGAAGAVVVVPKSVEYVYRCGGTGLVVRVRMDGVRSIADGPYHLGGILRVMGNEAGQAIGGPLVTEILE